ncbi:Ig-like domain-containing protein [Roseivirga echinicomitans]
MDNLEAINSENRSTTIAFSGSDFATNFSSSRDEVKRTNNAPVATVFSIPFVLEDVSVALDDNIHVSDSDGDDQTVTFTVSGGIVTLGTIGITFGGSGNGTSSFTAAGTLADINTALDAAIFTPNTNLNGVNAGTISYKSHDGLEFSNEVSVSFNIIAVNDTPTFTIGANQTVAQNSGAQTINGFITIYDDGDPVAIQATNFNISGNSNEGLFTTAPAINNEGNLTFTPDASKFGKATILVTISDDGGTDNGGVNTSVAQAFDIFITPTNIKINEVHAYASTASEFIEVYDGGGGNTNLAGLVMVWFNGSAAGDGSYKDFDLEGFTNAKGFYVIGNRDFANKDQDWGATPLQNGTDAVALFVGSKSDFVSGSDPTTDGLVDVIVYGSSDDAGLRAGLGGVDLQVEGDGSNSISRSVDGTGAFVGQTPTPGISNDITAPTVMSVTVPSNATYGIGQYLNFTLYFSENITVITTDGIPQLSITLGATTQQAEYISGSGSSALLFRYLVQSGDSDTDGIEVGMLDLNGGTMKDAAGNNLNPTLNSVGNTTAVLVDGISPTVTSVSSTKDDGVYKVGEVIAITVTFSEVVNVYEGCDGELPQLTLETGATDRAIDYSSGTGTKTLIFNYTVHAGDTNSDLDYVATTSLVLNGSAINNAAGNSAILTLPAPGVANSLGANKDLVIDTTIPTATITLSDAALKSGETATVTITFSEAVTGFTNADLTIPNGTLTAISSSDGGIVWTGIFTPTAETEDATNVITLSNTGVTDAAGNAGTGTIVSGNFTIDTAIPTATITLSDAALKSGKTATVTITFSEAVIGFTNANLTISNGTLTAVSSSDGGITFTGTFTPTTGIEDVTNLITLNNTGITDASGNAGIGTTDSGNFTIDTVVPTLQSSNPGDGATNVTLSQNLTLIFDDNMLVGIGNITIVETGVGNFEQLDVTDGARVSVSNAVITLNPSGTLKKGTAYHILIDATALDDDAANSFSGISDATVLNFTTVDVVINEVVTDPQTDWSTNGFDGTDGLGTVSNGVDEFVELFINSTGIDFTGWTIELIDGTDVIGDLTNTGAFDAINYFTSGTGTFNSSEAGDYFVLGNVDGSDAMNNDVLVVLKDSGGAVVDQVQLGGAAGQAPNGKAETASNESVQRSPNGKDTDTDDVDFVKGPVTMGAVNDAIAPTITSVSVPSNSTYRATDLLHFTVKTSENVIVNTATGIPQIAITIGGTTHQAIYQSGSGAQALLFRYTITSGDRDTDGIEVGTLDLNGGTMKDAAGNNLDPTLNSVGNTTAVLVDGIAPTVTSVSSSKADGAYKVGEVIAITVTFSEVVNVHEGCDGELPQLTLETGATDRAIDYSSGTGTKTLIFNYTVQDGDTNSDLDYVATTSLVLNGSAINNAAGNSAILTLPAPGAANSLGANKDLVIDTTIPTATITLSDAVLKSGETATVTITFSEAVTGFTNADLTIPNGILTAVSSSDGGIVWTGTFTPTAGVEDAINVISLNNTGVTDAVGNAGIGTTDSGNFTIDTAIPTAIITLSDAALKSGETATVTITFSEAVTGFTNTDLTIPNGTLTAVSSSDGGIVWAGIFIPTAGVEDVSNVITLNNTGVTDASGNAGIGTTDSGNFTIDTAVPTATITLSDAALKSGETATVTITFSEAVTGFTNADLTIPNGILTAVSSSDGGIVWTGTFTPTAGIEDATNVISLNNTGVTDASGNAGTGTTDSGNFTIDTAVPTATITLSDAALKSGETATVTITFSEAVTGFTNTDLTIPNGTLTAVSSSDGGIVWTGTFTPTAGVEDAINVISLNNTGVTDAVGNAGTGTTDSGNFTIDTAIPTATITLSDAALKSGETSTVVITFSEAVTGFTNADLTIPNGTLTAVSSSNGGIVWAGIFIPTAGVEDGTNVIRLNNTGVTDASGNAGIGTTDSGNFTIDTAVPTATITLSDAALKSGETATVTITFSEAVTGFTNTDLTIPNGTLTAVSSSDGGIVWTGTFTPTAGVEDGTNVIRLNNTGITDASGNAGIGTTDSGNFTIDTAIPTATITLSDAALKSGETATVTITFSEAVTGITNADLTIPNGTLTAVSSSDGGIVWTGTFTPTAGMEDAINVISLNNTGVTDAVGNAGTGTTDSGNFTIDTAVPTATITLSDAALKSGETATVTITFSEAVTGFTNADLTIPNGILTAVSSSDGGIVWTGTFTPTTSIEDATNVITLNNTGVTDASGNAGIGTTDSGNFTIDTAVPTATITLSDAALKSGETATVTITFSEAVTGFTNADLTIPNGTLTAVSSSDGGIIWTGTFTPTAGIEDATNVISLNNTGVTDAVGNAGIGTTDSGNFTIDTAIPTVTNVASSKADGTYGLGEIITVMVTFSEAVTVTGTPQLELETGAVDRVINYASGTGTNTLTFSYTVRMGDESSDLDYKAINSLTLNGGSIKDAAGNDATLVLAAPGATNSLGNNKALVIEAFPTVILSVSNATIAEVAGTSTITATLSAVSSQDVTVTLAYSGTATNGTDYNSSASTSITITAGNLSANAAIGITAIQDINPETNETIIIDIVGVTNGTENGTQQQTITITDDDTPNVLFASTTSSGLESVSSANITVDLAIASALTVSVDYTVTGTASGGTDYILANGTLTFNPSDISKNITIAGIVDDAILESNETVIVTLSNPSNANLGTNTVHTYTITDNDNASVTIADVSGVENGGPITLTATLDNAVQGGFTVDVSTLDGTATTADNDYTSITGQTLTFAGTAGETQTFTLLPTNDAIEEGTETLTVMMNNLAATTLGISISDVATITITDEDDNTAPTGFAITLSDVLITASEVTTTKFNFAGAEEGTTYTYTVSSSNGGTNVTGTGTIATATDEVTINNLSGLTDGTLTLSVTLTDASSNTSTAQTAATVLKAVIATPILTPANNATGTLPSTNLTMTFGENIFKGTGNITIKKKSDDSVLETIAVTSSAVTISSGTVTIDPVNLILPPATAFYVNIDAGALMDIAGNSYSISNNSDWSFTIIASSVVTSVAVPANATYKVGDELDFTASLTLPITITGTPSIPITIGTSSKTANLKAAVSNSNTAIFSYTITEGDLDTDGIALGTIINLNGATIKDQFGTDAQLALNNVAVTGSINIDGVRPVPTLTTSAATLVNGKFTVEFTFSEAVTGFTLADITVANGTASSLTTITAGTKWSAEITPTADGTVSASLAAGVANDNAGNANATGNTVSKTFDGTAPKALSLTRKAANPILTTSAGFRATFSEDVTGVDLSDFEVILTGTTTGTLATVTQVDAKTYDITITGISGQGSIGLNLKDDDSIIDAANNPLAATLTGEVYMTNMLPTDIALDPSAIDENNALSAEVGTLNTTDGDATDTHTYRLIAGVGDTDNGRFMVAGNKIFAGAVFNHEIKESYNIRLLTEDNNGGRFEKAFTITINDVNEAPTDISLSNNIINEADDAGVLVGTMASVDEDAGETFTYTLVAGTGDENNLLFTFTGDELRTASPINFESNSTLSIRVKVTDSGGLSYEEVFSITVNNVELEEVRNFTKDVPDARIKNFFSPNGDGINDLWVIDDILDNPINEVKVFSQNGTLIFSERNYKNTWNGTYKGESIPPGTYYYEINVYNGELIVKGFLTIIRTKN